MWSRLISGLIIGLVRSCFGSWNRAMIAGLDEKMSGKTKKKKNQTVLTNMEFWPVACSNTRWNEDSFSLTKARDPWRRSTFGWCNQFDWDFHQKVTVDQTCKHSVLILAGRTPPHPLSACVMWGELYGLRVAGESLCSILLKRAFRSGRAPSWPRRPKHKSSLDLEFKQSHAWLVWVCDWKKTHSGLGSVLVWEVTLVAPQQARAMIPEQRLIMLSLLALADKHFHCF